MNLEEVEKCWRMVWENGMPQTLLFIEYQKKYIVAAESAAFKAQHASEVLRTRHKCSITASLKVIPVRYWSSSPGRQGNMELQCVKRCA